MSRRGRATFFARTPNRSVLIVSASCFWLGLMHVTTQVRAFPPRDSAANVKRLCGKGERESARPWARLEGCE
jgi:hypothetical protein